MNETEEIKTYYENSLVESKEIFKKGEKDGLVIFNRNGQCTYSSTDDYEAESELKLHRDYFLRRY